MSDAPDKKAKKSKKAKKGDAPSEVVTVAAHPRAKASIRRTRARTALFAFVVVLLLSLDGGVTGQEAALRALLAGIGGNLIGWACALALWRQIVVQEVRLAEQTRRDRVRERAEAAAAARAEAEPATA